MGASKQVCQEVVDSLRCLPGVDGQDSNGRRKAVGETLMNHCYDDRHARDTGQHLLETCEFFPTPAVVVDAARLSFSSGGLKPEDAVCIETPPSADCPHCHGEGLIVKIREVYGNRYTAVVVCQCARRKPREKVLAEA